MLISTLVDIGNKTFNHSHDIRTLKKIALSLDLIASIALLVVGILAVTGILPLSPAASWALLGAGAFYAGLMFLVFAEKTKWPCC